VPAGSDVLGEIMTVVGPWAAISWPQPGPELGIGEAAT
jgi:hypothetical protein